MTSPPDLTGTFRRQLEGVRIDHDDVDGYLGPRGWLVTSGVTDVVAPFVTHLPADDGDVARFAGLDASAARALFEILTPEQLEDRQNDAPSLGVLLRATVAHPDEVELHGYLVGPVRTDERLTAEGCLVYSAPDLDITPRHDPGCRCGELWALVRRDLGITDASCLPHEVTRQVSPWRPNEPCWSLWWD